MISYFFSGKVDVNLPDEEYFFLFSDEIKDGEQEKYWRATVY